MNTLEYIKQRFFISDRAFRKPYINISNAGRRDLAEVFTELGFTKGVEIGTEKGKYSSVLMEANPELNLMTCDPYYKYEDGQGYLVGDENFHKRHYRQAKARLEKYPNCQIVALPSMSAIEPYDDNSIDFVYIDGNHRLDYVMQDIVNWTDIVKPGGIVALHDFIKLKGQMYSHVPYAVEAYRQAYGIKHIFVLDQKDRVKRTKEENARYDRIRTCFFIKND